jgi:hypothetical protein
MSAVENLAHAYHQRRADFVSEERFGGWRSSSTRSPPRRRACGGSCSTPHGDWPRRACPRSTRPGTGRRSRFAHDATYPIALIYWWQAENELHQRVFVGAGDDLTELSPVTLTPTGCVWELGVVEFERRAWIEDVIGNPAGPDLARYMDRRFEGLV